MSSPKESRKKESLNNDPEGEVIVENRDGLLIIHSGFQARVAIWGGIDEDKKPLLDKKPNSTSKKIDLNIPSEYFNVEFRKREYHEIAKFLAERGLISFILNYYYLEAAVYEIHSKLLQELEKRSEYSAFLNLCTGINMIKLIDWIIQNNEQFIEPSRIALMVEELKRRIGTWIKRPYLSRS